MSPKHFPEGKETQHSPWYLKIIKKNREDYEEKRETETETERKEMSLGYAEKLSYRKDIGAVGMSEIFDPHDILENKVSVF